MADDKFSVKLELDTNDANKKLKQVKETAKQTGEEIEKEHRVKIDDAQIIRSLDNIASKIEDITAKTKDTSDAINSMLSIGKITAFIGSIVAMGYALKKVYDITSDTADEIINISNKATSLFMNTNDLKAWETSFKSIGLSAQDADQALSSMNDKIITQMFSPNPRTAALFSRLGVQLRDEKGKPYTPEQVTKQVFSSLRRVDPYTAQYLGREAGYSPEMIARIRASTDFDKILKEQKAKPTVTATDEKQAFDFRKQQADFGSSLDMIKNQTLMPLASTISDKVIPSLNKFANELNKFINAGSDQPQDNITNQINNLSGLQSQNTSQNIGTIFRKSWVGYNSPGYDAKKIKSLLNIGYNLQSIPQNERDLMNYIINKESNYRNIPSAVLAESGPNKGQPLAYGLAQFKKSTLQGYLGASAEPMSISDTISGLHKEIKNFTNLAIKKHFAITPENISLYHHLGESGFLQSAQFQKKGAKTLGDVYDLLSPSGLMRKQNQGISNAILPDLMPQANQSSTISNAITNNKTVNNVATAHVTGVNVYANDPQGLAASLMGSSRILDMTNSIYGNQ